MLLRCILCLVLSVGFANAQVRDHITQRSWLEDASGNLKWPEVQYQQTKPYQGVLSKGFGSPLIWVKLRIDPGDVSNSATQNDKLFLRIRPVYLDDIQVYDSIVDRGWLAATGDVYHPRDGQLNGTDFLIPIDQGSAPRDIWLRLKSSSTRQIDVNVLNASDLSWALQIQGLVFSSYLGLVLVLAVWGFLAWLITRETLFAVFGLKQTAALLYAFCVLGFLRSFWPLDWPASMLDQASSAFGVTAVSAAILFHVLLFREFVLPNWLARLHKSMLVLFPVKCALLAGGWTMHALQINMLEVLVSPLIFLGSAFLAQAWSDPGNHQSSIPRKVVIGFYLVMVGLLFLASLPGLGLAQFGEVALYVVQAHGIVTAFLVMLMLLYRTRVKNQQQHELELQLTRSQMQAQQERESRLEQTQLLTMLAHELKTPLATMHMRLDGAASGSREIKQAMRDMNGVIERCLQSIQLGDQRLAAHIEKVSVVSLVRDAVSACSDAGRVVVDLPALTDIRLYTDQQLLFIVLSNLLENACKYSEPHTPINLKIRTMAIADEDAIEVEIANEPGTAGWPDPALVFEKYYRNPHARRKAGTGLGLYLVRNLVAILDGRIAYTPDDKIIRFVLHLPNAHPQ